MGGVMHARLQSLATGTFWEHSFRSDLKLQELPVERRTLEFLYRDGEQCWFMNPETCEQIELSNAAIGSHVGLLESGVKLSVEFVGGRPVGVLFPDAVEVKIAATTSPIRQQDNTLKPATLENGIEVMVPQFVKSGDVIRVDLQTMKYMDRVKTNPKAKHA
jgi:elongation factor P